MERYSDAQRRFLAACLSAGSNGYRSPWAGNRAGVSAVSAWHRTAKSLQARGAVVIVRTGDAYRAYLPPWVAGARRGARKDSLG